jgi:rhamnosyl/mannosyltransferase
MTSESSRLRVLHVGKFYPPVSGGMERVLQLLCERERTEVDTRVLVANTGRSTAHDDVDGVPVTRAGRFGTVGSVAICPSYPLLLARERADVIVIHEPNPIGLLAYMLVRPSARLIVWFHSEVVRDRWKYALFYKPWFSFAMRRASRVIVASPPMTTAEQLRPFPVRAAVIPYGVDQRRLALTGDVAARAARLRAQHPGPLALFVGRMVPYKGLDVLVRAMADVPATAVLVGGGPQRDRLEALATELGVRSKIVFAGEQDEENLVAWYHACDLFVLPSTTRAEAFGVVQTEAMACGKPVVSTAVPSGVPWVNRDGETGLVVPPGDAARLADALRRLVEDPELRRRMGEAGRRRVADEFTADRMSARAVSLYREVVSESNRRAAVATEAAASVPVSNEVDLR